VKINHRADGVTIKYFEPVLVGKGTDCELGTCITTNESVYFFNTTVLYSNISKKSKGTLMIELDNNNSLNLKLFTSELAKIKNRDVSVNVYYLEESDVKKLRIANIKKIVFKDADNKYNMIFVSSNPDFASKQLKCLD
jgi:hypothetical protein